MTQAERTRIEGGDLRLLAAIDEAMAEAGRRGGMLVACRRGCMECCRGPFEITMLDGLRLKAGMLELERRDSERARRVMARVEEQRAAGEEGTEERLCPALDPETGTCELYEARPVTCRTFGPATRTVQGGVAACERCYAGEGDAAVAARAVEVDPRGLEGALLEELEALGWRGMTTVAEALGRQE